MASKKHGAKPTEWAKYLRRYGKHPGTQCTLVCAHRIRLKVDYNRTLRHSANGFISPAAVEANQVA